MPSTRESKVEQHLVEQAQAKGALVRKLAYIGRRGAPDRMVIWPHVYYGKTDGGDLIHRIDFVELKAPGQKPDDHQAREHERLRRMGCNVFTLDSIEAVDQYIKDRS